MKIETKIIRLVPIFTPLDRAIEELKQNGKVSKNRKLKYIKS